MSRNLGGSVGGCYFFFDRVGSEVDPVGACVGIKGSRVQAIVRELRGEKIDIIPWTNDPRVFIGEALNPASIEKVGIDEQKKAALVVVADSQLSLAIGKNGQNVRLAAKLTGWKIDIISASEYEKEKLERERDIKAALAEVMALARAGNGYFDATKPFLSRKTDMSACGRAINICLQTARTLTTISAPFLPFTAEKCAKILSLDGDYREWATATAPLADGHELGEPEILVRKLDAKDVFDD